MQRWTATVQQLCPLRQELATYPDLFSEKLTKAGETPTEGASYPDGYPPLDLQRFSRQQPFQFSPPLTLQGICTL